MTRTIQVWAQGEGTYCAIVRYQGTFDAIADQRSPGDTTYLSGTETGTIEGGYQATLTNANLLNIPFWPTEGSVGTTDYQCNPSGNCRAISWMEQYFQSGFGFSQPWWGWIYHGGDNGTWVNSSDGNSGDIF